MPIRDWTRRGMVRLWILGLALELALFVVPLAQSASWQLRRNRQAPATADTAHERVASAQRESLATFARDSLGLAISRRHDTVDIRAVTPRGDSVLAAAGSFVGQLGRAIRGAEPVLYALLAAIYLPIPVALAIVTLVWRRSARRRPQDPAAAAA